MNWFQYFLVDMFLACVDVHDRTTYFIYGYLLVTFAMWKWKSPHGRDISHMTNTWIAKLFDPWNIKSLLVNTNVHNAAFTKFYE
jgi:hypothetical protein